MRRVIRHGLVAAFVCVIVAACGGLDPIVSPGDGGLDATLDGVVPFDASSDVAPRDAADGAADAADAADAALDAEAGAPFACGSKTCDSTLHYCEKKSADGGVGDAGLKDGGIEIDTCVPYPASCTDDGGKPSCSCVVGTCTCSQNGTEITVTCP